MWRIALLVVAGCGRLGFDPDAVPGDAAIDDGDMGDGSGDGGVVHNRVFVTSTDYEMGSIGGLANADALCMQRAVAGGLAGNYRAWLSSSTIDARDRFGSARGWVRIDGKPVADTVAALTSNGPLYPIAVDELGARYMRSTYVVTGTGPNGMAAMTCGDYTNVGAAGQIGSAEGGAFEWTGWATPGCNVVAHLYCFQIDHQAPLEPLPTTSRRAFLTSGGWTPTSLADADALCAMNATAGGLVGSFRALLATTTQAAAARFVLGTGWARLDNTIVTTDLTTWDAALDQRSDGGYELGVNVWTGAADPNTIGAAATTCADWTTTTTTATAGIASKSGVYGFDNGTTACASTFGRLYCFQE